MFDVWARPDYRQTLVSLGLSPRSAESVARAWPDPGSLSAATVAQLQRQGLTPGQARRLLGAVDLAKLANQGRLMGPQIRDPDDAYQLVGPPLAMAEIETMAVVMLNAKARVIDVSTLSQGSPVAVAMLPGDLYRAAIRAAATSIIVAHELTKRLLQAGRVVGIPLVDHLVIARGGAWCSLAREGLM